MKMDLHVHSEFSHDSAESVENILNELIFLGIDAVSFSEHVYGDTFAPLKAYEKANLIIDKNNLPIKLYAGAEFSLINSSETKKRTSHVLIYDSFDKLELILNSGLELMDDLKFVTSKKILAHPIKKDLFLGNPSLNYINGIELSNALSIAKKSKGLYELSNFDLVLTSSDAHKVTDLGLYTNVNTLHEDINSLLAVDNVNYGVKKTSSWIDSFDPNKF